MKIMVVAGARPNFMKVAPVLAALDRQRIESVLVHTGQHYDRHMSRTFFEDLSIAPPDYSLNVGSGTHAVQTARIMEAFEPVFLQERPSVLLVPGDVNSTLACSLVAAKMKPATGCLIAHLEAGLRSGDSNMPEEINRVLTDRISDLLLTPSRDAAPNLVAEGIPADRIHFVGNVMIDTLYAKLKDACDLRIHDRLGLPAGTYVLVTLHRPSNVDYPDALATCINALARIAERDPVVFPIHPRTRKMIDDFSLSDKMAGIRVIDPLGYTEMLSLMNGAKVVLTDSGGVQEETTVLGVSCVTLRQSTERPVTVSEGTNRLVSWPLSVDSIVAAYSAAKVERRYDVGERAPEGWDGQASDRIVEKFVEQVQ